VVDILLVTLGLRKPNGGAMSAAKLFYDMMKKSVNFVIIEEISYISSDKIYDKSNPIRLEQEVRRIEAYINQVIATYDIDLIHVNCFDLFYPIIKSDVPVLYSLHDNPIYRYQFDSLLANPLNLIELLFTIQRNFQKRKSLLQYSNIHLFSNYQQKLLSRSYPDKNYFVIPQQVNPVFKQSKIYPQASRDFHIISIVGQISFNKNQLRLLEILKYLSEKKLVIVLVGSYIPVGGYFNLRKLLGQQSDHHQIYWLNDIDAMQVSKIYLMSDLYISFSQNESFGLTVLEALQSGLPVVATKTGGFVEFRNYYPDQLFLIDHDDTAEDIAEKIRNAIDHGKTDHPSEFIEHDDYIRSWLHTYQELIDDNK